MALSTEALKPRLLVVTDDTCCGGTANVAYQLASSLQIAFDVRFACRRTDVNAGALAELQAAGVRFHAYDVDEAAPWRNSLQSVFSVDQALDLLEESDPDLVLTVDASELISFGALKSAAGRCGVPYVDVINILLEDSKERVGAFFELGTRHLDEATTLVFACDAHRRRFELLLPENRVPRTVISNSRPDKFFQPRNPDARRRLREEFGLKDENALVCLTTARIEPHKGQMRIVRALALLDGRGRGENIHLVFAGAGQADYVREVGNEIANLGLEARVSMLGARSDVVDLLDASDIFILPSKSEATSLSIIEAMAKGLAVVATGVDGILELIDESCAVLLPLEEDVAISAIAEAIDALQRDTNLRFRLAEAGRRRADDFRVEPTIARYVDLLTGVLKERRRSDGLRSFARTIAPVGAALDLSKPELAWNFLQNGWSISEAEGVWTNGASSTILLRTDARKGQTLRLVFEFAPFLAPSWPSQESYVFVDEVPLAFWRLASPGRQARSLVLEAASETGTINIRFEHCRAVAPSALGLPPDPRELALFFYRIEIFDDSSSAVEEAFPESLATA